MPTQKLFDLHCDTLTECHNWGLGLVNQQLHFSLDRLPQGYRLCQCMAVFMPDQYRGADAERYFDQVYQVYLEQLELHKNRVACVDNPGQVDSLLEERDFALMLTVEGGSVLAGKLENLYKLQKAGVKMMTLTWNAENEICGGARSTAGFTDFGRQVIPLMEELGIVVDVSHLNDKSFYQLCEFAKQPFVASHSNARAICFHPRNLTDDMFGVIRDRGGVVGLNYFKTFITDDARNGVMDDLLRHVHHFLSIGGEDTLVLGSDFDGADLPDYINCISKLEDFHRALERSGIPGNVVEKILYDNARRFFVDYMGGEEG